MKGDLDRGRKAKDLKKKKKRKNIRRCSRNKKRGGKSRMTEETTREGNKE
jgi:hypothetical protein